METGSEAVANGVDANKKNDPASARVKDRSLGELSPAGNGGLPAELQSVPASHQFSVGIIGLFLKFVLSAASSQRCAAGVLRLLGEVFPDWVRTPCPNTGRLWMLRIGLYALKAPKQQADDWVWIMDHTLQLGQFKCLVIVGVRLSEWNPDRGPLKHEDLKLLNLTPMKQSTGESVHEQLVATSREMGLPRAILSDGGSDLKRAMQRLHQTNPEVAHLYDIKHKTALLLKKQLEADERWKEFLTKSNKTKLSVTQTALAFLNPPALKTKARYMNLDLLVNWGQKALRYLDEPRDFADQPVDRDKLTEKLGWLRDFREPLNEWSELLGLAGTAEDFVRQEGYHRNAQARLRARLKSSARYAASQRMKDSLLRFVDEQSSATRKRERLPGSSEVLESLIGKYKRLQSTHSQGGMSAMLLSFGAIVLDKTTDTLQRALETITTQDVSDWVKQKLGMTIQAQRKLAFEGTKPAHKTSSLPKLV